MNALKATELDTLKELIWCYMNLTSIFKNKGKKKTKGKRKASDLPRLRVPQPVTIKAATMTNLGLCGHLGGREQGHWPESREPGLCIDPRPLRVEDGLPSRLHFLVKLGLLTLASRLPGLSVVLLSSRNQDLRTLWLPSGARAPLG